MGKKLCNWCDKETSISREDFSDIHWSAVGFGGEKMVCACPGHRKEIKQYIKDRMEKKSEVKE